MAEMLSEAQRIHVIAAANDLANLLHRMNESGVHMLEIQRSDPITPYEHVSRALNSLLPFLHKNTERLHEHVVFERMSIEEALAWMEKSP
jgi:hypothetical protein